MDRTACARMKARGVVLLVLLLSGQSGADHLKKGLPSPGTPSPRERGIGVGRKMGGPGAPFFCQLQAWLLPSALQGWGWGEFCLLA